MKKCAACGGGPITRETRQTSFEYKGKTLRYDQPGEWCADCGEVFLDKSDKEATDPLIYNFQAKIDGRLTTDDILRIRKKLKLTQKEAGEQIGGGPNAFSRYETGKAYPTRGTENFLRVLDKHPDVLSEMLRTRIAA
jgi:HTH-type transcriptional regulator/antitoxin MqsA